VTDYARLYQCTQQLLVFSDVLEDPTGQAFTRVLQGLALPHPNPTQLSRDYAHLFNLLAEEAELYRGEMVGNGWQNHLLDRLLDSRGIIARKAHRLPRKPAPVLPSPALVIEAEYPLGMGLISAGGHDLDRLQALYQLNATELALTVRQLTENPDLPAWSAFKALGPAVEMDRAKRCFELKKTLAGAKDWAFLLDELFSFYRENDPSDFNRFQAFRWRRDTHNPAGGRFEPVRYVDDQRFENLVGYEKERNIIIANTEQFIAGLPANHALLYGARGTGKSSTVKALLPRFAEQGLRLVEVPKSELADFPLIAELLRDRPEKFILFVDDLSFEADESSYKDLKALLEGSLEARPRNLLIYATSNRRHLIKEQFSDNAQLGDDEVNAWDTVEEKLSLSDRFGLIVTFMTPNQQQYLAIVSGLAGQAALDLDPEELRRRALRWELSHSGRSGRTARQFIDQLTGELGLQQSLKPGQ
jgi:uncharacterized protein